MKLTLLTLPLLAVLSCGAPKEKMEQVVIDTTPKDTVVVVEETIPEPIEPTIPNGAITANFKENNAPFYGYVDSVNRNTGQTRIAFEETKLPPIVIKDSYGAELSSLRFPEFNNDLLLVAAKLKDPQFKKYYLYQWDNTKWKQVVNGWAIHVSNKPDTLKPIVVSPRNPQKTKRYYSVFDLDKESATGYRWKLLQEEVAIAE